MAIGVFIAPILLYREALSSLGWPIASPSVVQAAASQLPEPDVTPPTPIRSLDQKCLVFDAEELVSIGRASLDPAQLVGQVAVKQKFVLHCPSTPEFGDELRLKVHFAGKSAVFFEMIPTTLDIVGIPPFADQRVLFGVGQTGTGRDYKRN